MDLYYLSDCGGIPGLFIGFNFIMIRDLIILFILKIGINVSIFDDLCNICSTDWRGIGALLVTNSMHKVLFLVFI